ncbi:unnamed protein product [Adineta ricciae]|uniref:Aminotransferase class I/classII large domain-containing protein n=1 Tax=Adineta ricciae TaxID=249248 RepID=A0A815ZCJ6_ADIRI|nr:unnamed protein product [Adineta ricciae]CAF1583236.1 unnamed protein product [Adineta ricciae]
MYAGMIRFDLVYLIEGVRLLGPNSIIQASLPRILNEAPKIYFKDYMAYVQKNAELMFDILSQAQPTIEPHKSQGALYMLIRINPDQFDGTIENEIDCAQKLMDEQAVSCIPCTSLLLKMFEMHANELWNFVTSTKGKATGTLTTTRSDM